MPSRCTNSRPGDSAAARLGSAGFRLKSEIDFNRWPGDGGAPLRYTQVDLAFRGTLMDTTARHPRFIVGVAFVLLGVLLLMSNVGLLYGVNVWAVLWGLVWLWLGAMVVGPRGRGVGSGRLALGLLLIAVGAITLAHGAGLIGFSFGDLLFRYWPLILIALGVFLLYQYNRRPAPGLPSAVERIEHDSIFGDFKLTQPGWRLRDVRASSVIGDMKIDLSKADIPDGETVLDLSAVVGDIDVWAPLGLPVALDARCTFVSLNHFGRKQDVRLQRYTDAPADFASSARRVRIQVDLVFGDLTLTRVG